MYKRSHYTKTGFNVNQSVQGETLEQKIEQITNNKEPIKDGSPLIFKKKIEREKTGNR